MARGLGFAFICLLFGSALALGSLGRSGSATTAGEETADTGAEALRSSASLGRLAFVRNSDIWVQEVPGGDARRLTDDGLNERPLWSPSGAWIAFWKRSGSQVDLWVVRGSGADARPIGPLAAPWFGAASWSPREDRLAFIREGSLWVLDPDTGAERQLVAAGDRPEEDRVTRMVWSPDGQWIAYERINRPELRPDLQGIFRIQPDGRNNTEVFLNADPFATQSLLAGWSPDGARVLFWEGCCMSASQLAGGPPLMAVPTAGGQPVQLSRGVLFRNPDDVLAWSPDGSRLALVDGPGREVWEQKAIQVVTAGSPDATLVSDPDRVDFYPSWSPQGDVLAYASGSPPAAASGEEDDRERALGRRRIWTMRPDGSGKRQLTADDRFRDERPRWIGDTHILFARLASEVAQLWLMRDDGAEQQPVADLGPIPDQPTPAWFGFYGYIDWSRYYDWWRPAPARRTDPSENRSAAGPARTVTSFAMVRERRGWTDLSVRARYEPVDPEETQFVQRIWFRPPNQWRFESVAQDVDSEPTPGTRTTGPDGETLWHYDAGTATIEIWTGQLGGPSKGELPLFGTSDLSAYLEAARRCYTPEITGEANIAGRAAIVIDLGATRCLSNSAGAFNGPETVWLDQETLFVLRRIVRHTDLSRVALAEEVTEVGYDLDLPDDLFAPVPPEESRVVDHRTQDEVGR
jgi:Tol biopolymer transport system component/outer membrane lipoprotein-sorting protein